MNSLLRPGQALAAENAPPTILPRAKRRLSLAVMLSDAPLMALIFTALPPVLVSIAAHFGSAGDGRFIAQLIMTMPSIGLIAGGVLGGWLVDRFGARGVLYAGLACYAISGSAGLYLNDAHQLMASRLLLGASSSSITTATAWMLAQTFDPMTRARLLGFRNALGGLAGAAATFAAGSIAELAGWRAPFAFYALAAVILPIALLAVPRFSRAEVSQKTATLASLTHLWPVYAATIALWIVVMMTATQLSFLLADAGVVSPAVQSRIIGMSPVLSILSAALYGPIRAKCGARGTFSVMTASMGLGIVLIGASDTLSLAALGTAIAGFGSGIAPPYFCNLIFDQASEQIRGRALGFLYSAMFLGDFLNPIVVHPLSRAVGIHSTFIALGALVAASSLLVFVAKQRSM